MPLEIKTVAANSLASEYKLKTGDIILSINGHHIHDFIDLQFYSADEDLDILLRTSEGEKRIHIQNDWSNILGIEPTAHRCTECINKCIFCFVDQIKPDFRKTLHIKDDDYRLSFTYGNFITLTNITSSKLDRIIKQRLSPLYVSVHTTDPQLHHKILRYSIQFNIYERLRKLLDHGIQLHTQVVVIPEWNDKEDLVRTIKDLDELGNNILSVGIVPIGLTNWRQHLTPLRTVTTDEAKQILDLSEKYPRTYCADELFMLAGRTIPEEDYYDDYPQLENGIGMLRLLMENWKQNKTDFLEFVRNIPEKLVFVTGVSAFPIITGIAEEVNRILPDKARSVRVNNITFGSTVSVAGLLTASDIMDQVELSNGELILLPSNMFNDDDLTLDNISQKELKQYFGGKLLIIDEEFMDWRLI
jgi:putative radical SAM enzyme (TIGR03279 family)